jgi:hypothetical protein
MLSNAEEPSTDSCSNDIVLVVPPLQSRRLVDRGFDVLLLEAGGPTQYDLGGRCILITMHTYVRTYIHTYVHTYVRTYKCMMDLTMPFSLPPCTHMRRGLPCIGGDYFAGPVTRFDIPLFWHASTQNFPEFKWQVS